MSEHPLVAERALVVENEPDVMSIFVHHLGRLGFDCDTAASAERALVMAGDARYDLAVVDLLLPGMSGDELIKKLREAGSPRRPAIVATSILDAGQLEGVGADAVLQKPFRGRSVAIAVEQARRSVEELRNS